MNTEEVILHRVNRTLGCGFLEPIYQEALSIEFQRQNLPFEKEKVLSIRYKDIELEKKYIADFVCYDKIILELKALSSFSPEHESQVLNYLTPCNSYVLCVHY